jgi:hypothetical protein
VYVSSIAYYDDREQPNALAVPTVVLPTAPDGTVLIDAILFHQEASKDGGGLTPLTIMAHELVISCNLNMGWVRKDLGKWSPIRILWFPAVSSGQLEIDFAGDQVDDRHEIAQ